MIFVLNNHGYLIERLLCKHGEIEYNDVASWNYQQLPTALGCENWFTARVTTCGELDQTQVGEAIMTKEAEAFCTTNSDQRAWSGGVCRHHRLR